MFDTGYLDLMTSLVTYYPYKGRDVYGEPSFSTPSLMPAYVTYTERIVRSRSDEESVSTAQILIPCPGYIWQPKVDPYNVPGPARYNPAPVAIALVTVDDRIQLPFDDYQRKVVDVTLFTDEGTRSGPYGPNPNLPNEAQYTPPSNVSHQSISLT